MRVGKLFNIVDFDRFMHYSTWYYRKLGIHIDNAITYISSDVYLDSADYSAITIHSGEAISREVLFLVYDYSIHIPMTRIGWDPAQGKVAHFIKPVTVGKDSFIGARVTLLGGTQIGENCIIGANTCVKGRIPDNSIVISNPARVVGDTRTWARHKLEKRDWVL